jgi:hypothetical protein
MREKKKKVIVKHKFSQKLTRKHQKKPKQTQI